MQRALRECKVTMCHELTRNSNGYCDEHQDIPNKKAIKSRKILYSKDPNCIGSIYDKFYWNRKWKSKRQNILAVDDYICLNCLSKDETTEAKEAHHIETIREAWEKRYDSNNIVSLCEKCHKKTHSEYKKGKTYKTKEQDRLRKLIKNYRGKT